MEGSDVGQMEEANVIQGRNRVDIKGRGCFL